MHRRIRQAYNIGSRTEVNDKSQRPSTAHQPPRTIDSETPEAVYGWLDEFELAIGSKYVGSSLDYPSAKYTQSKKLTDSKGYRKVKMMQKEEKLPTCVKEKRKQLK